MSNYIPNKYDAKCAKCGTTLAAYAGRYYFDSKRSYHIRCLGDGMTEPAPAAGSFAAVAAEQTAAPAVDGDMLATAVAAAATDVVSEVSAKFLALVPDMVREQMLNMTKEVTITVGSAPPVKVKRAHYMLPTIVRALTAKVWPYLVGPAGSGKTTLGMQAAETLKVKFYMEARVTEEHKLMGYLNIEGKYIRSQFREAYEHGGVFLFDEVDASDPDAMTAFNSALSNGICAFPDGNVVMHKNFYAIASGNTFGRGADRRYCGRNQLDAATLDRFVVYEVDYDEDLEFKLAGDSDWVKYVQLVRKAVEAEKLEHVVSPRASIAGAKLLAAGETREEVIERCIWKGFDPGARKRAEVRMALLQANATVAKEATNA